MLTPSRRIFPEEGMSPAIARNVVVLPAPLVPTSAKVSPPPTSKVTSKRAWVDPYHACRCLTSSMGSLSKVRGLNPTISQDVTWDAIRDHAPRCESYCVAAQPANHLHVVFHYQHRRRML